MRILIVDDDPFTRFLLTHMLEDAGYTDCYEAESGEEALLLAEKVIPDLVLLDIMMPGIGGFEVAPKLKQSAGDIYLPIIFITALDDKDSLAKCLEVGGDDFALKPFDKVILTAKIRAHARTRLLSKKTHTLNKELTYFQNAVEREHAIVEHIFSNALTINQDVKHYFDYRLAPASNFNGDLFLVEPSPSGGMYFVMGDFTGHGLASAIGALPVTRAFQAMAAKGISIAEMSSTINQTLLALLPGDMFFAAIIGEISRTGCQITVWNGGMPDLILLSPRGDIRKKFTSLHMALGILDADEFDDQVDHVEADIGDRLVGYSDGLIELTNQQEKMLGEEAMLRWLQHQPDISVHDLEDKIAKFRGHAEQVDDITLISYFCQKLEGLKPECNYSSVPFAIHVELGHEQLKSIEPIHEIILMLASQLGMRSVRSDVSTVLSELYNNALDHGVLHLESKLKQSTEGFFDYYEQRTQRLDALADGVIELDIDYQPKNKILVIQVKDSGKGFDVESLATQQDFQNFGRGIMLVKELSSSVEYAEGGSKAIATIQL